jgi:hypothetical protein
MPSDGKGPGAQTILGRLLVRGDHGELVVVQLFFKIAEIRGSFSLDGGAPQCFSRLWHLFRIEVRERCCRLAWLFQLTPAAS